MVLNPNANWTAAIAEQSQAPVYYIAIDGLTTKHYSTAPVKSAGTTKTVLMDPPQGGAISVDIIAGTRTVQQFDIELLDVGDEITDLLATEASGAPLSTLINRKVTLYAGYRQLAEADYASIFVGRIRRVRANRGMTAFTLTISDSSYLLDGEIMSGATDTLNTTIRGNIVNLYWAILTGTFSTTHGTFPLDSVSTDTTQSSAPSGLGIATTLINEAQLQAERDAWHVDDVGQVVFTDPENARQHLEDELFRVFQCFPAISGDGLLGLKFHVPAMPASAAPTLTADEIVSVRSWERLYGDHLNKFTLKGDYVTSTDTFGNLYTTETSEDTTDQSNTAETVEYLMESRWLDSNYNGVEIATELAGRMRIRYLKTPAVVDLEVNFTKRNLEQGDVVAITHPDLPDLFDGTRGISGRLMSLISTRPNFERGTLSLRFLDTGYKRYGVIAPNAQADWDSATDQEKDTFFFISSNAGVMSDGSDGYRFI
jgi:hypothetical protein